MLERIKPMKNLVNEMLDQLPESIWISNSTTFLDPAIGGGQFVKEIESRLKQHGHSDANIRNRVHGFETTNALIDLSVNMNGLIGQYVKLDYADYFRLDTNMQFDLTIGNPPYQKPKSDKDNRMGSRGKSDLWSKFVKKNLALTKPEGYFSLIHPTSWRKPEDSNNLWQLLTQDNQLLKLKMSSGRGIQDWFKIQIRVDYYVGHKKPKYTNTTVIDHDNVAHDLDLEKFSWLPNYAIKEVSSLLGEGCVVLYNAFYHTQKAHKNERDSKFKYPVVHTINQSGLGIRYFDKLQPNDTTHFGVPKVLLNQNELQYPYNDYKGEFGMSQLTFGIAISSKEEGDEIVNFLNTEKGKKIIAATKWNTYYTDYGMFKSFRKDWYK